MIHAKILEEEGKLDQSNSPTDSLGILYNLISLKNNANITNDNYKDIKKIVHFYIEAVRGANFGYDVFNYNKIDYLLNFLKPDEQIALLQYAISVTARELPEHDWEWFIERKHTAERMDILINKKWVLYPKAFFLFCGQNVKRLIITLIFLFLLVNILIMPAPSESMSLFNVKYEEYSQNTFVNHLLNVASFFADIENDFKIIPKSGVGLCLLILGKVSFVILIVNFIYIKISDKISLK